MKRYMVACIGFAALYVAAVRLNISYRGLGMTMVVLFGLLRGKPYAILWQLLCLAVLNYLIPGRIVHFGSIPFSIQNFGTLAIVPIFLYNGKRGMKSKVLQYGAYLFYPVHMGILAVLHHLL